jgi:hypothetical protein
MSLLRTLAIIALLMSVFATGVGGVQDLLATQSISRRHAWNDGQYLALLAIALLLLAGQTKL